MQNQLLANFGQHFTQPVMERRNAMAQQNAAPQRNAAAMMGGGNAAMAIAERQVGLNETEKKAALTDFLQTGGQNLDPATTAWCAAFVNSTLKQAGKQGTGKLNARSFLDWGEGVDTPQVGDLAVFSRGDPSGWQGHVGFFKGYNPDGSINVLGGNQGDSVSVKPYAANNLLGFRRG